MPSDYGLSSSTILTARFGYQSTKLIRSVEQNLYVIIGLIAFIAILSVISIFGISEYFQSSVVDTIIHLTLLAVLIAVLVPLVILLMRSRVVLEKWTEMFERNTITSAMAITMNKRTKEEAIFALIQSVGEIGVPLEEYIASRKSDLREFCDVPLGEGDKRTTYDVLMDSSRVLNDDSLDKSTSMALKKVLEDYGTVIVKIVDGYVDRDQVESFVVSLSRYVSISKKQIGLGIIIGEEIRPEAEESVNDFISKKGRGLSPNLLLLIDKPSPTSDS